MEEPIEDAPAVKIENLTIRYGAKIAADRVSFSVPRGSICALLGRNGAGKSSILRCLAGQLRPQAGSVLVFGHDPGRHRDRLKNRVGFVGDGLAPPRSWTDPRHWLRGRSTNGSDISSMLVRALSRNPELLILDEPTRGLDERARREFLDETKGRIAGSGTTVLIASKEPAGLAGIADRICILRGGRLVLNEKIEAVKSRFRKIRYSNDRGAEGAAPGMELDPFFALAVQVRGWGVEAVVSDFTNDAFARFLETPGVVDAESSPLTLEELFRALAGPAQ